jgi:hypothetical protein
VTHEPPRKSYYDDPFHVPNPSTKHNQRPLAATSTAAERNATQPKPLAVPPLVPSYSLLFPKTLSITLIAHSNHSAIFAAKINTYGRRSFGLAMG